MREQGDAGARTLEENDLGNAVRDYRLADGVESLSEAKLQALFLEEERRVADAAVLAELLVPRLRQAIAVADPVARYPVSPVATPREEAATYVRTPEPAAAGSVAIPDLLDAMLAADGAARRRSTSRVH